MPAGNAHATAQCRPGGQFLISVWFLEYLQCDSETRVGIDADNCVQGCPVICTECTLAMLWAIEHNIQMEELPDLCTSSFMLGPNKRKVADVCGLQNQVTTAFKMTHGESSNGNPRT